MIKEFVKAWDANKGKLEEYIRTHIQDEYDSYEALVKLLFDHVINPEMTDYHKFDIEEVTTLGGGDYSGTLVFVLHEKGWGNDPSCDEYVYTYVDYGSCCVCDTLQGIVENTWRKLPTGEQVAEYMTLCLHLLQRCHRMLETEDEE